MMSRVVAMFYLFLKFLFFLVSCFLLFCSVLSMIKQVGVG